MRALFLLLLMLVSFQALAQELPDWAKQRLDAQENIFQINDNFNLTFLEADFNGDDKTDIAIAVKNNLRENKSGIVIYFKNGSYFLAGAGNSFGSAGDDFSWADEWKVFEKEKIYQITFKENGDIDGEEEVLLKNPAISIRQSEGSGGLIYFNGEKFIWIHQGD